MLFTSELNKDDNPQYITQTQIIKKIVSIIDANDGDVGRLSYILEFLKQDKPLYHSDHMYLENKFNMLFMIIDDEKPKENELISKIQKLIDSDNGDHGRLQHICDMLSQDKPLYRSDQVYLDQKFGTNDISLKSNITHFDVNPEVRINHIDKLEKEIILPEVKHNSSKLPALKLRGLMPQDLHPPENNLNELTGIYEKIKTEEEILDDRQKIYDEINLQRSKLSQLILNRKDYEKQVLLEKTLLESQIKEEHINIQTQTKISEQIISQKEELEKVKSERNGLMKKIAIEKDIVTKDLQYQKNHLTQTQLEQEEIEKQIKQEQILLAKMFEEQKFNLLKQSQIAREIKEKQTDLEKTKKECDDITSQVTQEKTKLNESEKLKKLIKLQENDLIKAKEERLKIIEILTKEKENISKKTKEEQDKLQIQSILAKQLEHEKKTLEKIKQKRKKVETQIKIKNQKLKIQQQKIKKQILEKNKKLKSLGAKSVRSKPRKPAKNHHNNQDLTKLDN